jgi:hypothetical protein
MNAESENDKEIDSLTTGMFHQICCPKSDALTVFIPEGQKPSSEVQKVLDEAGHQRWFPQEGGHLVKIPNVFDSYDDSIFKIEKDAWDHEHCDKCGATINYSDLCWAADMENSTYLFCESCYQNLKQK